MTTATSRRRESGQQASRARDLSSKVSQGGGRAAAATGFSLLDDDDNATSLLSSTASGLYGRPNRVSAGLSAIRAFPTAASAAGQEDDNNSSAPNNSSPAAASYRSRFSAATRRSSAARSQHPTHGRHQQQQHIVCAISENRARETTVAAMDAGAPANSLTVTKQANGQQYGETVAYLELLQPDEILLNQGRQHSPLVRKIRLAFRNAVVVIAGNNTAVAGPAEPPSRRRRRRGDSSNSNSQPDEETDCNDAPAPDRGATVIKFLSRAQFDQTRGAELLRHVVRPECYDNTVVEDYTLLSACHAVLQYTAACLAISYTRGSISLTVDHAAKRMRMDRSTALQLELLVPNHTTTGSSNNSKTAKSSKNHSLVASIDCTKTVVGSRLLRTNLIAPPTSLATIQTRLELVDLFLSSDEFFFQVMEHLEALPDVDKMLSSIATTPQNKNYNSNASASKSNNNNKNAVNHQRIASRGISALVCIKAVLSALPSFAGVLQQKLRALEHQFGIGPAEPQQQHRRRQHDDTNNGNDDGATVRTDRTSLLIGLGVSGSQSHYGPVERFHLLRAILCAMTQPALTQVLEAVCDIFTETTTFSRNANAMRHQECFALKCDEGDLMTVLRKAFLGNVDDIYKKADEYAEVHGIQVQVRHSTSRGYFLAVPATVGVELPQVFLQPAKSGRSITCTTEEIASLNTRAQDNMHDLLLMTHDRIQQNVLQVARCNYDAVAALCDAVALLDLCHSFADKVTLSRQTWCRPVVVEPHQSMSLSRGGVAAQMASSGASNGGMSSSAGSNCALMIRKGRFAIDINEASEAGGPPEFVPNDTYAPIDKPFTVITGINGSGKSTYLKQVAMIVILAQIGSYVPAEQASIPIRDQLFCRIGNADDQEHNLSTFLLEMKETAFICNHASKGSLVLVDELGRATSNEDGVAIAWATSEYLLKKQAMTMFVTHYPQLTRLSDIYPRVVQNVHLAATVVQGSAGDIRYTHQLQAGACPVSAEYGVELAAACGWPADVFEGACVIQRQVEESLPDDRVCDTRPNEQDADRAERAVNILEGIRSTLEHMAPHADLLSSNEKRSLLCDLQEQVMGAIHEGDDGVGLQRVLEGMLFEEKNQQPQQLIPGPPAVPHPVGGSVVTSPRQSEGHVQDSEDINRRDTRQEPQSVALGENSSLSRGGSDSDSSSSSSDNSDSSDGDDDSSSSCSSSSDDESD